MVGREEGESLACQVLLLTLLMEEMPTACAVSVCQEDLLSACVQLLQLTHTQLQLIRGRHQFLWPPCPLTHSPHPCRHSLSFHPHGALLAACNLAHSILIFSPGSPACCMQLYFGLHHTPAGKQLTGLPAGISKSMTTLPRLLVHYCGWFDASTTLTTTTLHHVFTNPRILHRQYVVCCTPVIW